MARKLKTFVTHLGFFEQAVAAPSMKAALEAWGVPQNLFHQGFAVETVDPKIVAAATAQPGVVLKRAVGSKGAFTENPDLPSSLPARAKPPVKKPKKAAAKPAKAATDRDAGRAQIAAFEKTRAKREKARAAKEAKQAAAEARETKARDAAVAKMRSAFDNAEARHDAALAGLARQQQALEQKIEAERERWRRAKTKLERRLRDAQA